MRTLYLFSALIFTGCATAPVQGNAEVFMLSKSSARGVLIPGDTVKVDLYKEATEFCAAKGRVVETIKLDEKEMIPFPSATLHFLCIDGGKTSVQGAK